MGEGGGGEGGTHFGKRSEKPPTAQRERACRARVRVRHMRRVREDIGVGGVCAKASRKSIPRRFNTDASVEACMWREQPDVHGTWTWHICVKRG